MPKASSAISRMLLQIATGGISVASLSDDELLARFVANRDEEAFAGLVHRHGPTVLAVCRRVIGDAHLAEDALQAVFLVLGATGAGCEARRSRSRLALRRGRPNGDGSTQGCR